MKLKLNGVRLAFPALFEAKTVNGEGTPAFSAAFLIDPKDPQVKVANALIDEVAREKWGGKADAMLKQLRAADKVCLHDGNTKAQYAGFEGMLYISARNDKRPLVIDRDKTPLQPSDGRPYGGCYVNAVVDVWAQDNNYGKRINASLSGVQFLRDGDAFVGGGAANPDDFEELGVESNDLV
jgi:hypothetical protein